MMNTAPTVLSELAKYSVQQLLEPVETDSSCVQNTDDINKVLALLQKKNHVWVLDDKQKRHVTGVCTHSDILSLFASPATEMQSFDKPNLNLFQYGLTPRVEEIMSRQPITSMLHETISEVIAKMTQYKIKQIAVVDENGCFLGEISLTGIISAYIARHATMRSTTSV